MHVIYWTVAAGCVIFTLGLISAFGSRKKHRTVREAIDAAVVERRHGMSIDKATPRPWVLGDGNPDLVASIKDDVYLLVADCATSRSTSECDANAELIVLAVNSYDALRKALVSADKYGCEYWWHKRYAELRRVGQMLADEWESEKTMCVCKMLVYIGEEPPCGTCRKQAALAAWKELTK